MAQAKIDEKQVRQVAKLARLALNDHEISEFAMQLSAILGYIEKLNELDTSSVEPMTQVLFDAGETATLRPDVEGATLDNATALANAPLSGAGQYKVPKVIER